MSEEVKLAYQDPTLILASEFLQEFLSELAEFIYDRQKPLTRDEATEYAVELVRKIGKPTMEEAARFVGHAYWLEAAKHGYIEREEGSNNTLENLQKLSADPFRVGRWDCLR